MTLLYTFRAENYCAACGEELRKRIPMPADADPDDDASYDSDDWPKPWCGTNETDSVDHCAGGAECLSAYATVLLDDDAPLFGAETRRIGEILTDELTAYGVAWLRDTLAEQNLTPYQQALYELWRDCFGAEV